MFGLLGALGSSIHKLMLYGVIAMTLILCGYAYGWNHANSRRDAAALAEKVADIMVIDAVNAADQQKRLEQEIEIKELQKVIDDARLKITDQDRACFEPDDVDQLRQLWR